MCVSPATTNSPSTSSLIVTMMLFAVALSRTPSMRSQVINATITNAGTFTSSGIPATWGALWNRPCRRARHAQEQEGQHERRPGAAAHQMAGGVVLPRRRRPDRPEDPGADHRADPQHDEIAGAQRALQRVRALAFDQQLRNRLAGEELPRQTRAPARASPYSAV